MKNDTLVLNDYCTTELIEVKKDAIKHVISSRIGNMVYSTLICDNGHRVGVMQSEQYIKERLAEKKSV